MLGNVRSLVALVALYSACFSSIALAEQRLALVIGNAAYKDLPQLFKARNDARAVGATLRQLKFDEVQEGYDLSRDEMSRAFSNLIFRVERGGTVFFFFAGHGVEIGGQNYLLPTDVPAAKEGQENLVKDASFHAAQIIDRFQEKGAKLVIVVLDACRSNPFERAGVRPLGVGRGLAPMERPGGTFTFFSAGAKQEALDQLDSRDENPNSVFTRVFVPGLIQPRLTLVEIAKKVQKGVHDLAATVQHPQDPAYYDGVIGDIYLTDRALGSLGQDDLNAVLDVRSKPDGSKRYRLSEIAEFGEILPSKDQCEEIGNRYIEQFRQEDTANTRFWVRMAPGDFGYCRRGQQKWYVEYFDRDLQDALVVRLRR